MNILEKNKIVTIKVTEAQTIIDRYQLFTVRGSWHYSWNLKQFYDELFLYEVEGRVYVFNPTPIHKWAPAPLFSNDPTLDMLIGHKGKDCPYWFLELKDFETFLDRRSTQSRRPDVHFPSRQTYRRVARKLRCHVKRYNLFENNDLFNDWYDQLKDTKYNHSAAKCVTDAVNNSSRAPRDWFIFYALIEDDSEKCKCVSLMIDDGRSCSGINIASERSNLSYGTFFLVEVVRHLCSRGYNSFDCGVSARYGTYKDKIYLDVLSVDSSGTLPFVRVAPPTPPSRFQAIHAIGEQFVAQLHRLRSARVALGQRRRS